MSARFFVSEIFDSIQGEGASQGTPCTFLRLAGCNLACTWCDTEYSWNWKRFDRHTHVSRMSVDAVSERLSGAKHVVVTGGEPLLQQPALQALFPKLGSHVRVEVETNATVLPQALMLQRVNQWNVSPKLRNSGEQEARRIHWQTLAALRDTGRAWLKLVVDSPADSGEALALIDQLQWPNSRVYLMPQCRSREELARAAPPVEAMAAEQGLLFTSRLHLQLWNGERGR